jgi:adapter protein MecA 1/2
MNDLEERGIELADFLMPQEKTEDFFYAILEEVDLPDHFKMSGMLSFRVTPKKDKIDILVTKSDMDTNFDMSDPSQMAELIQQFKGKSPDELMEHLPEMFKMIGDKEALERLEADELTAELQEAEEQDEAGDEESFDLSEEVSDYVHYVFAFDQFQDLVTFAKNVNFPVEAAEVYKYGQGYQMTVLLYVEDKPRGYADTMYSRMLEHAKPSKRSRAYLREHGQLLREGDVLQELAGV